MATSTAQIVIMVLIIWASFVSYLGGPDRPYSEQCAYLNDLDNDGDVDMRDVAILQNGWSCAGDYCGFER